MSFRTDMHENSNLYFDAEARAHLVAPTGEEYVSPDEQQLALMRLTTAELEEMARRTANDPDPRVRFWQVFTLLPVLEGRWACE